MGALQTRPTKFLANLLFFNAFLDFLKKYHMYVIKAKFCHFEEKFAKNILGTDFLANFRLGSDLAKKYRIHNTVLLVPTFWSILFRSGPFKKCIRMQIIVQIAEHSNMYQIYLI
jgi:hypothetical protein